MKDKSNFDEDIEDIGVSENTIGDNLTHKKFFDEAITQANIAAKKGEIPIGCVIVKDGKIVAKAYNRRERTNDATAHAEVLAIKKACKRLKNWRLTGCDIYVTLEPCMMCMGAIVNARIRKIYYCAPNNNPNLNHNVDSECIINDNYVSLLRDFFANKR
ncbi:MAG: nucleoside deaminase [Clostridiales bacterium]|jgi:tRNA(adenine34) deaminase|nr:nucleoside deaminase [Clostridiales bacterium]